MEKRNKKFTEVIDVIFIMALCFTTLLSTMLMRGKVLIGQGEAGGLNYAFDLLTFSITFGALAGYSLYIIQKSNRELGQMVVQVYGDKEQGKE